MIPTEDYIPYSIAYICGKVWSMCVCQGVRQAENVLHTYPHCIWYKTIGNDSVWIFRFYFALCQFRMRIENFVTSRAAVLFSAALQFDELVAIFLNHARARLAGFQAFPPLFCKTNWHSGNEWCWIEGESECEQVNEWKKVISEAIEWKNRWKLCFVTVKALC